MALYILSLVDRIESLIEVTPEYIRAGYEALSAKIVPELFKLIHKTQDLWAKSLPYITALVILSTSPIGISIGVIALSTIPLQLSRTSSKIASIVWLALGLITALYGAHLLSATSIIPALPFIS